MDAFIKIEIYNKIYETLKQCNCNRFLYTSGKFKSIYLYYLNSNQSKSTDYQWNLTVSNS